MAKIPIGELDLNVANLIKDAAAAKKAIADLREENKLLAKSEDDQTESIVKNEAQIKKLSSEYRTQQNTIGQLVSSNGDLLNSTEAITIAIDKENESINSARANNAELTKLRNELNLSTDEGQIALAQINEQIDKNNIFIKENVSEQEKQRLSVGGYADAIKDALGGSKLFGESSKELTAVFGAFGGTLNTLKDEFIATIAQMKAQTVATEGLSKAQKVSAVTTNAVSTSLKLFRIALIATGIGAIVVVLGSLIAFLSSTQEGIDKVTAVTRPLTAVFGALIGVLQDVGKFLFDAFSKPKESLNDLYNFVRDQLMTTFKAFGKILEGILNFDFKQVKEGFSDLGDQVTEGVRKAGESAKAFADRLKEAAKIGSEIDKLQKELERGEIDILETRAKTTLELKRQENIIKDRTKTDAERTAAIQEQERLAKSLVAEENKLLDLQISILEKKQSINDTSREEEKELKALVAQRIASEGLLLDVEKRSLGVIAQLENERESNRKAAVAERIKGLESEFKLFQEQNRFATDRLEVEKRFAEEEIKILDAKFKSKLISEIEYNTEILKVRQNIQEMEAEKQRLAEETELENTRIFEEKKRALSEQLALENAATTEERELLKLEQDFAKKEEELQRLTLDETEKTELLLLLEEQKQNALANLTSKFEEQKAKDQQKVTDAEIKVAQARNNALINLGKGLVNAFKGLLGDSLAGRLAGLAVDAAIEVARVQISTASAQAINLANAAALPIPANIAATVAALKTNAVLKANSIKSTGLILGSAAVQGISTVSSKFEQGGIVGIDGKSHAQGGVPIFAGNQYVGEAEGNEGIGILNQGAFKAFMGFNNKFGNGKMNSTFAREGTILDANGIGNNQSLAEILANMPRQVVYVEDIKLGVSSVNEIEVMANV